jgi:hypothetical protein
MSDNTSALDLLSRPLEVNRAYSSLATLDESIFTALVFEIPNVKLACPPISESTSAVLLLSKPEAVNLAYSSSATELLSILTALVLLMPNVKDA